MQPPCPHCDQSETSLLRLVLIGEILRAEEPEFVWLADVMQQSGLWHLAEEPMAPPGSDRRARCMCSVIKAYKREMYGPHEGRFPTATTAPTAPD